MAITRQGGSGIGLNNQALPGFNNKLSLPAGASYHIPPGQYYVTPGPYSMLQTLDPITNTWSAFTGTPNEARFISTDGTNVRLVNLTGCAIGAFTTNVGSGYTSAPVVTASAGGSTWTAVVGGAISATVTVGTVGTGYTFPPLVVISAPPVGGVPATATCVLSGAGVGTVAVVNQGAGYAVAPTVTFVNDPRDTTGFGAVATTALTGSGTITAVICNSRGTPQTAVPTLAFSGGGGASAAATAVMCLTATGLTVGTAGAGYGNAQPFTVLLTNGVVAGTAGAVVNPTLGGIELITPRIGQIQGTSTAGGAVTATGAVIVDGGLFNAVPNATILAGGSGLATTVGQATVTVGGVTDTSSIQSF